MQTELKPNLGSENMQTNPRLIIHQQYIYHPPYSTDYINIFILIPLVKTCWETRYGLEIMIFYGKNVDPPSET